MLKGAAVFLIVGLVIASGVIAAVEISPLNLYFAKLGTLAVKLTDTPVCVPPGECNMTITSLMVTIDSFKVHRSGFGNLTGDWIDVPLTGGEATFDLLTLRDFTQDIAITSLPEGMYTQIRMHVRSVNASIAGQGTRSLDVPSGELKIPTVPGSGGEGFTIREGQNTTLILDLDVDSFRVVPPQGILSPVVHVTVQGPE